MKRAFIFTNEKPRRIQIYSLRELYRGGTRVAPLRVASYFWLHSYSHGILSLGSKTYEIFCQPARRTMDALLLIQTPDSLHIRSRLYCEKSVREVEGE